MNYLQPERLDALARAYALGTLSPRAARRFARIVASSAVAAHAVAAWQELLGALEEGAPGSPAPRPRVWDAVQQRLFERDLPTRGGANAARGSPGSAAGWLRWPIGLAAGAAMLWATLALRPQTFGMEPLSGAAPASYVGVLQDPQGRALLATSARRHGLVLTVRLLRPVAPAPGQSLTIWAWSDVDATPRRVGNWTTGQTAEIALPGQAEALLGSMTHLGLSNESASAVPAAPTRPFIAEGPCAKVW
jgi:anti-sigma-K factor RskA